jgi:hypothetical protein
MMEKKRVSAYGSRKEEVHRLSKGDLVFYYHKGQGIVAGAEVTGGKVMADAAHDELFWTVKFLTAIPERDKPIHAFSVADIRRVTGKNFFWARTAKVPYLSLTEAQKLLDEVRKCLGDSRGD